MGLSLIRIQRDIILDSIKNSPAGQSAGGWKVVVVDEDSRRLIDNVVREDDILELRVTNIDQIEQKRPRNSDTDALYILTPQSHVVDCLISDLEKRRYAAYFILWTSILPPALRDRLTRSRATSDVQLNFQVLNIDFNPRESHLATFKDPYSFPILFHPGCSNLVQQHVADLAQRIMSVCVALGECPAIRFYKPREMTHDAAVLSQHLAQAVQSELDTYLRWNPELAQPTNRPKAALYIVDRSIDLFAPFIHEFTYQAMAHDLLPIQDGDKVTFRVTINEGKPNEERDDMELTDKDKIWLEYRHMHMKDTIAKLEADFNKFLAANRHFASADDNPANVNVIKDMLAGLTQFQEDKKSYTLHLTMAEDCMKIFGDHKLPDLAALEQTLATGLDEDFRKPKNIGDQVVRTLDEPSVVPPDRLRIVALYILYKFGLLQGDITKLLMHAQLPLQDQAILYNLEILGARPVKPLKDTKSPAPPIFPKKPPPPSVDDEVLISRFEPALKNMLDEHISGTLDPLVFPYVRPDMAQAANDSAANISSASLRSAKPTWASRKLNSVEPRQRIIVFMAGGATYSEARACYEASDQTSRDVVLVTSHMLTPGFFLRQLGDLSADRRSLGLPVDRPAKRAPAHLFEDDTPKAAPAMQTGGAGGLPGGPRSGGQRPMAVGGPPVQGMSAMSLNGSASNSRVALDSGSEAGKLRRKERESEADKKKKKHLWSRH